MSKDIYIGITKHVYLSIMNHFLSLIQQHPVVPIFLFINLAIGFWAHRKAKAGSFEDYASASRNLPTGVLIMTVLATVLYSEDLVVMDLVSKAGIITPVMVALVFTLLAFLIGTFFAPKLVFFDQPTVGGVMGRLYGEGAQLLTGALQLVYCLAVVLYSTFGGMRAVSYTDVFQLLAVLLVLFWVTQKAMFSLEGGGTGLITSSAPEKLQVLQHPRLRLLARIPFFWVFGVIMSPPVVHRMLMVRDKSTVSKMWYTLPFIYGMVMGMMTLIALFAMVQYGWNSELGKTKNVLAHVIANLFSGKPWVIDALSVGIMAVLLSTMDSFFA